MLDFELGVCGSGIHLGVVEMSRKARRLFSLAVAFVLLLFTGLFTGLSARLSARSFSEHQNAAPQESGASDSQPSAPAASQDNSQPASPTPSSDTQENPDAAAAPASSVPTPSPDAQKKPRKSAPDIQTYSLTDSYSVSLGSEWTAGSGADVPPPAALSPYAPFHLSGNLVLTNPGRGAILQFATSNNPFIGHDAYWLDTQMHSPSGSGMSLLDFFFYYFFPPSDACMHQVLTTQAPASRASVTDGPAYMQVYYSCPLSDTLSDFYAAQVSAGVTFQLTDNGTRVLAPVGDFYVAPMEQVEESGITFFVFEAQGMNAISSDAASRFHLPASVQGGQPDFFWAIGAADPFPFVADPSRKDPVILHVAYARLGVDADAKTEFMSILHEIRAH